MDRATLIRGMQAADLGFILHSRHQFNWHTGYVPPQTVAAPHLGAWIARTLGPLDPAVPAFINIGQRFDLCEGEELKAFTTAGFIGSEYGPFNVAFPEQAADTVRPPNDSDAARPASFMPSSTPQMQSLMAATRRPHQRVASQLPSSSAGAKS